MSGVRNDRVIISNALLAPNPGIFLRESAKEALQRVKEHIAFDRTQREFLAADLVALAEGKPVKTALAEAVAANIKRLEAEGKAKDERAEAEEAATPGHVCGLSGYNPMIHPPCPGCAS
jgi:hypothetical protein